MKKVLSVALLFILCFAMVFSMAACGDEEVTGATLEDAVNYFNLTYKADNGKTTSDDFSLISQVKVQDTVFPITYTVDNANITITYNDTTKMYVVDLPATNAEKVEYKITATISNEAGETATVVLTRNLAVYGEKADEITAPVANVAYKLSMVQGSLHKTLYALNVIDSQGKYIETTVDPVLASDYYVEVVEGGYKFYTMVEGAKKYVEPYLQETDDGHFSKRIRFVDATETVLRYDETYLAWTVTLATGEAGNVDYCLGTYGDYATISISDATNYSGSKRETQYALKLVLKEDAEDMGIQDDTQGIEDPTELTTIVDALAIGGAKEHNNYTIEKYLVQGVITEVKNATYGNVMISDGTNSLYVYGLYSADGSVRYDAMETKPVVGDTITVMGVLGQYNDTVQLKNGWLQELVPGEGGDTPVDPEDPEVPSTNLVVVDPVVGTAYKFGMVQGNLNNAIYYLVGGMDGYYLATTTDASAALDVYLEETTGGYYLYCYVNEVKTYINVVVSGTHVNGAYEATASTVYTYDTEKQTLVVNVTVADDTSKTGDYWFGTRNDKTYDTVGPCLVSYNGFYCQFYAEAEDTPVDPEPEVPTLEGEGTVDAPYILPAAGDYTCAYPANGNLVWYTITIENAGYVTVSSTIENAWLKLGTDPNTATANIDDTNSIYTTTLKDYFLANSVIYIGVAEWTNATGDIPFTVSYEAKESDAIDAIVGSWNGQSEKWGFTNDYGMTINADGTGTITMISWGQTNEYEITFVFVDGERVIIGYYEGQYETSGSLKCTFVEGVFTCTEGMMADSFVWNEGELAAPEAKEETLIIGNNSVNAADTNFTYTAAGEIVLVVTPGNPVMGPLDYTYTINSGDAVAMVAGEAVEITLAANDVLVVSAVGTGYGTIIVSEKTEGGEDVGGEGGEDVGGEPVTGTVVYLAVHAGGRKLMVTIDTVAGTMVITRSDMTGNFTGGATTVNYTYAFDGTDVTYALVDASSAITTMTFDASGAPVSITWGSQVYENFEVQGGEEEPEEPEVHVCADTDGDYLCDDDTCGLVVEPADGTVLTIPEAIKLATATGTTKTTGKFYVVGIVTKVGNSMTIKDADGNEISLYVVYASEDHSTDNKYNAFTGDKPGLGDTATFYGNLNCSYSGAARFYEVHWTEFTKHTCEYAEGVCTICGAAEPVTGPITSIADALAAAEGAEVELTGTVVEIREAWSSYNNMSAWISDGTNRILVWRMVTKVYMGDVITVTGVIGQYDSVNQVAAGSTAVVVTPHTCDWVDATCTVPQTCKVCGATQGEALGHNMVDGVCANGCGLQEGETLTTLTISMADIATANSWANSIQYLTFTHEGFTFTASAGTNNGKYYTSGGGSWRFYSSESGTLTITAPEGKTIKSINITWSQGGLSCNGTAMSSGMATTVSGNEIVISATAKTFITAIEIVYA